MNRIYLYKGKRSSEYLGRIKAELTFAQNPAFLGIMNRKAFKADEAVKGLEALKRWVSTGAFSAILIENLSSALEKGNKAHLGEWIEDHASDTDSPMLILLDDAGPDGFPFPVNTLESGEDLLELLNTK